MLTYREIAPAPLLARFVRCFWVLRGDAGSSTERILPDGSIEWIVHLGDPFTSNGSKQPLAMIVGEMRRATMVESSRRADVFGIRFQPGGAACFLRIPIRDLDTLILPIAEVVPESFHAAMIEARTTADRVAVATAFLIRSMTMRRGEALAQIAVKRMDTCCGVGRVSDLAKELGTTERSLERAFAECVGMSPKVYSRLVRFRAVLRGDAPPESYFDESHFIRDCHEFAGTTPAQLRREINQLNELFVGNVQDSAA